MKTFSCRCGQKVFFDSKQCVQCNTLLGFSADSLSVLSLSPDEAGVLIAEDGNSYRLCGNAAQHDICNWLIPAHAGQQFCAACQLNNIIPNLQKAENLERWASLEEAKRRLVYTLLSLGLPLERGLVFEFLEDGRTDPERYGDSRVSSGYLNGVITINVLEADPVAREAERAALNEPQRTLLGHMRHESGHHFYHQLCLVEPSAGETRFRDEFAAFFGDPETNYSEALARHYEVGPPVDWQMNYISAYAACHPLEDWAETWSHYLNMVDSLETGASHNLLPSDMPRLSFDQRLGRWRELSTAINELNRSGGAEDVYPYIISPTAANKLKFVERAIRSLQAQNQATAAC